MICQSILDAMGNTPIIRLNNIVEPNMATILVKFEGLNVGGSIKTRTGYNMIKDAEERGLI
ncbi:MAG: cysteine synthase A, partial [Clostridia bacterium]|nr:cysteine synthase A [Clostridia bacterium]